MRLHMLTNIIQPNFTPNPQPPRPTFSRMLVFFRRVLAIWRVAMAREYSDRLPVILPSWWTVERVINFANGGAYPLPAFTATITRVANVRTGWIGQSQLRLTA